MAARRGNVRHPTPRGEPHAPSHPLRGGAALPPAHPVVRDLVLAGAGASHLVLLRRLATRPLPPDIRVTFVTREAEPLYSGMVPGVVAGRWTPEEARVDLPALAQAAGARWIQDEVTGLDPAAQQVRRAGGPPLRYDLLSLAVGSAPALVPGAAEHAVPIRPFDSFLATWERLRRAPPPRLLVVGLGAGGVEIAFATRQALPAGTAVALVGPEGMALPRHGAMAQREAARRLAAAGLAVHRGAVRCVAAGALHLQGGATLGFDAAIWAGGAAPPAWLADTGLVRCPDGFLAVDAAFATSDPRIFAAGDVATVMPHPRERAGVFAVRQGLPLLDTLRRVLDGRAPRAFRPQREYLAVLLAGPGVALATRGGLAGSGAWALWLKDRIDRQWVESFSTLPRAGSIDAPSEAA